MVSLFADTGQMQTSRPFGTIPATGVLKLDWMLAAPPAGNVSRIFLFVRETVLGWFCCSEGMLSFT